MLLSRTFAQGKAAGCAELPFATVATPCLRQPQQLSSLMRFSAAPALQQAARRGHSSVMRSFATEAHDAQQLSVKEAIKSELEYEHDNHDPEAVIDCTASCFGANVLYSGICYVDIRSSLRCDCSAFAISRMSWDDRLIVIDARLARFNAWILAVTARHHG